MRAQRGDIGKIAMDEEYATLCDDSTWDIASLPLNPVGPVGCGCIFERKLDDYGIGIRHINVSPLVFSSITTKIRTRLIAGAVVCAGHPDTDP